MHDRFRPLAQHLAFSIPDRLTDVPHWHAHIPFAMALVTVLRPRVLVELGAFRGDSYSAMCQAVDALGLSTRCYAVDTWEGDQHVGSYGDEVFEELRAYHDPRYGRFSTLVRSTFDDALAHFPDGEVDLLHVDGAHTEEAVRHDYETWRPKLSRRAVVLFHDTNVRERDFGVWRFWDAERRRHPSFEFAHSHGLGVLVVGPDAPPELLELCGRAEDERRSVARFYEALGERVAQVGRLRAVQGTVDSQRAALAQRDERIRQLEAEAARVPLLAGALARSEARVRELEGDAARLHDVLARSIREGGRVAGRAPGWRRLANGGGVFGAGSANHARGGPEVLELLRGSGLFDAAWYLSTNPDVAAAGVDPLVHFYENGWKEDRDPNPWFDTSWYVAHVPEVAASGKNPLVHYLERGARELRDPHPRFCAVRYLAEHPELEQLGLTPLAHFLRTGVRASPEAANGSDAMSDGAAAGPEASPRGRR